MTRNLPADLRRFVIRNAARRILLCLTLFITFGVVLWFWGDRLFPHITIEFRISCYVVCMLLPFPLAGVPHKLFDHTFGGKVLYVDVATTEESWLPGAPALRLYDKNTVRLHIVMRDGRELFKKVAEGRVPSAPYVDKFHQGDEVFHLYGSKYTVVLPKPADTSVQCAVCGTSNDVTAVRCRRSRCRHTLVKELPISKAYDG